MEEEEATDAFCIPSTLHDLMHWDHGTSYQPHDDGRRLGPSRRVKRDHSRTCGSAAAVRAAAAAAVGAVAAAAAVTLASTAAVVVVPCRVCPCAAAVAVLLGLHWRRGGVGLEILCLGDPVEVAPEVLLQLLALAVFLEVSPGFGLLSLLGKLSAVGGGQDK